MKERGILFSAPMVRALLAGTKTVTRRILKPQPHRVYARRESIGEVNGSPCHLTIPPGWEWRELYAADDGGHFASAMALRSPYGCAGDRLWVRETWRVFGGREYEYQREPSAVIYRADPDITGDGDGWRPSIFMPRWASRITLEIAGVACERLHDITEAEAKAEGVGPVTTIGKVYPSKLAADVEYVSYRLGFATLWKAINGGASWTANPWVWAVTFKRVEQKR